MNHSVWGISLGRPTLRHSWLSSRNSHSLAKQEHNRRHCALHLRVQFDPNSTACLLHCYRPHLLGIPVMNTTMGFGRRGGHFYPRRWMRCAKESNDKALNLRQVYWLFRNIDQYQKKKKIEIRSVLLEGLFDFWLILTLKKNWCW